MLEVTSKYTVEEQAIVFHDDLDGMFCAALSLVHFGDAVLIPVSSNDRWKFNNVMSDLKRTYKRVIVVDYSFSSKADVWFDHHPIAKGNDKIAANVPDGKIWCHNPSAKSAFGLMVKELYGYTVPGIVASFAEGVDCYDSAGFPSPSYTFERDSPLNYIYNIIELSKQNRVALHSTLKHLACIIAECFKMDCSAGELRKKLAMIGINNTLLGESLQRAQKASEDS